ncbi:Sentrin-specific protease 1, partial [Trichinella sp. T8]
LAVVLFMNFLYTSNSRKRKNGFNSFAVEDTVCKRKKTQNELYAKANGNVWYYFNESKMWLLGKIGILKDKNVVSPQINTSGTALSERQRSVTNLNQSLIVNSGITHNSSNSAPSLRDEYSLTCEEENTDDSVLNSFCQSSVRTEYEKFNNTKESFLNYSKCSNVGEDEFSYSSSKVNLSPRFALKNNCASKIVGTSFSALEDRSDDEGDFEMHVKTEEPPVGDKFIILNVINRPVRRIIFSLCATVRSKNFTIMSIQANLLHQNRQSNNNGMGELVNEESQYFSCEESSEPEITKEPNQNEKSLLKGASNGDALSNFDFPPEKSTGRLMSLFNDTLSNTFSSKIGELRNDLSRIFANLFKRHDTLKTVSNGSIGSFTARPFPRFQVLSIKSHEYRELTAEEAQVVKKAWQEKNSDKILSSGFGIDIRPNDLKTLAGGNWLNDETIDFRKKTVLHYDSLGGSNATLLRSLKEYLCQESKAKGHDLHIDQWTFSNAEGVPRQGNFNDCGVFVCKFADYLSRDAELSFNQSHMANFRLCMAYEILNKQLIC